MDSEQEQQPESNSGGLVGGYVKVDTSSADGLIKAAVDMFRALEGRDPTDEELAKMDASLASHSDISQDPMPVNPDTVVE